MMHKIIFYVLFLASFVFTNQLNAVTLLKLEKDFSESQTIQASTNESDKNSNELWLKAQGNLGFLENKGQMRDLNGHPLPHVLFKAEAAELNLWITENGVTFQTFSQEKQLIPEDELSVVEKKMAEIQRKPKKKKMLSWERIEVELLGGSIRRENIVKENPQQGLRNYYLGNEIPVLDVNHYTKITIKDVYPGIDWVWHFDGERRYKYDFVVHPGADYRQIKLQYKSKNPIKINQNGEVELYTQHGNLKELKPLSFLDSKQLNTRFLELHQSQTNIHGELGYETTITFNFPETNQAVFDELLIIDPEIFWSTLYGGNSFDGPQCLKTDDNNNIFIGGYTFSTDFPVLDNGGFFQGVNQTETTSFVLKFSESGSLIWSTYIGGFSEEYIFSLDIDDEGNVYGGGLTTSANFPLLNPGGGTYFQNTNVSDGGFLVKFSNNGNLLWSTFFPLVKYIKLDTNNNLFVCSDVLSNSHALVNPGGGAYNQSFSPSSSNLSEIYISKFTSAGTLQWSTYFGGNSIEVANSITIDNNGNLYLAGLTQSTIFPFLDQGNGSFFQNLTNPLGNAFLAKFSNSGVLLWSTSFGGNQLDSGVSVEVDQFDNVFFAGQTSSSNITCVNPGLGAFFQNVLSGTGDLFLCKFSNSGSLLWSTYLGSPNSILFNAQLLSVDNCGRVHFSYNTESLNNTVLEACEGGYMEPGIDLFMSYLMRFSNNGQLQWSTYIGGGGVDIRCPLTHDSKGNLIVVGEWGYNTDMTSYPLVNPGNGAFFENNFYDEEEDGFIIKFDSGLPFIENNNVEFNLCLNSPINSLVESIENTIGIGTPQGLPPGVFVSLNNEQLVFSGSPKAPGVYDFSIPLITDVCDCETLLTFDGVFTITTPQTINISGNLVVCEGNSTVLTANNGFTSYEWSDGSSEQSVVLGAGTYNLIVTDSLGCQATTEFTVTSSSPSAGISSNIGVIFLQDSLILQSTSVAGLFPINSWNWNFGDGNTSNVENPSYHYSNSGTYLISLIVTDELGCTDTAFIEITVVGSIVIPNVVTPNNDSANDMFFIQNLNITLPSKLIVLNRWGNVVFEIENYQNDWSPNELIDGVYFYTFKYLNKDYQGFFHVFRSE